MNKYLEVLELARFGAGVGDIQSFTGVGNGFILSTMIQLAMIRNGSEHNEYFKVLDALISNEIGTSAIPRVLKVMRL